MTASFLLRQMNTLLFAVILVSCSPKTGDAPFEVIKKAAMEGLRKERGAGLPVDKAGLGEGFEVYTILPDRLLNGNVPLDLQSVVTPTGEWKFPAFSDIKGRILIKVAYHQGKWQAVGIDMGALANEIAGLRRSYPESAGYRFRYINVFLVSSVFIELSRNGQTLGLFSLSSLIRDKKRVPGTFKLSDLLDPKKVLIDLQSSMQRKIEFEHWEQSQKKDAK